MPLPPNLITNRTAVLPDDLRKHSDPTPKRPKYRAVRVEIDGHKFDSKMEARRYLELKLMERAGKISDVVVHPRFLLKGAFQSAWTVVPAVTWTADFCYEATGRIIVEDVKGVETREAKLKHTLFRGKYPEYELRIVKEVK